MAQDPIENVAGNVNPGMLGNHSGKFALAGMRRQNRMNDAYNNRQFKDSKRLLERQAQLKGDLMSHEWNLNDLAQRRAAGVDSDDEVKAAGGLAAAAARNVGAATTVMGPNGQMIGRSYGYNAGNGVNVNIGGFTAAAAKPKKQTAGPVAPESERPTHKVERADTDPSVGQQFYKNYPTPNAQEVQDLRNSPAGRQTKGAGQARAKAWGPLSAEDKAMDARRATPAEAVEAETSTGEATPERKVARAKDATRAGASVSATGSAVYPPLKSK